MWLLTPLEANRTSLLSFLSTFVQSFSTSGTKFKRPLTHDKKQEMTP